MLKILLFDLENFHVLLIPNLKSYYFCIMLCTYYVCTYTTSKSLLEILT